MGNIRGFKNYLYIRVIFKQLLREAEERKPQVRISSPVLAIYWTW